MPFDHLQESISPPGSTLYYALRQLPDAQRIPCRALFGLYRELQALVFSSSETNYVQFGWWHQELNRLLQGCPRHPLTQTVASWPECAQAMPLDWLMGLESSIGVTSFDDESQLLDLCSTLGGPLFRAVAALTGAATEDTKRFMHQAGAAYTSFGFIANLGRHLRRGVVPIPQTELGLLNLASDDLLRPRRQPSFAELMELQYMRVSTMLYDVSVSPLPKHSGNLAAALIISNINRATLEEIKRNNFDVVDNQIDITPLRKAWIARTTYRRMAKKYD